MKVSDIFTVLVPATFQVKLDAKLHSYIDKLPVYDDIIYQVSQYKNKRSKKRCTLYWPFTLINSLFNRKPTLWAEEELRDFALKNGYVAGVGNDADKGVIVNVLLNNKKYNLKETVIRYEDVVLWQTWDKVLSKGLGIQVSIKASSLFFQQMKEGKIQWPWLAGKLFHIISIFKDKNWYMFVDSDSKHSRASVSKEQLQSMLKENAMFPRCRVILPVIKLWT